MQRERNKLADLIGKRLTLHYDEEHNQISLTLGRKVVLTCDGSAAFDRDGMYFAEIQASPIDY